MNELTLTEQFLYGGMVIMIAAAVLALIITIIFLLTGHSLKKKLKNDYGEPWRYNL
ncbi:hypothetical protein [Oribacterium sp. NK2B42]|uniref:hypothetical protein n=1 Tax=Oribacterium sp. NK2B42 TaxID=689781 RepID=UPI0003F80B9B|nr:hypothetical protein [Oribacterium sp. NK2B42]